MSSDANKNIAIRVENLSKCYHIYDKPHDRLKQMILPRLQRLNSGPPKTYYREFWALKDVSFEVKKGETVGIIGRNGSGKSTLLQMICGTLNPTSGSIQTHGRVAALLELGSGFNPEFTGRENVYMNATVLGLSKKEIDARFDDIVAFADIGEFIEQPVKTYSSGMMVRLAFAVVAHVDADILVVDEALSVGDVFFSQKCMRFIEDFQTSGGTVLFVSHDSTAVMKLCRKAILLSKGQILQQDTSENICKTYLEQLYAERKPSQTTEAPSLETTSLSTEPELIETLNFWVAQQTPNRIYISEFNKCSEEMGLGGAKIVDAGYFNGNGERLSEVLSDTRVVFSITLTSNKWIQYPAIGLALKDRLGQAVFTESTTWAFEGQYGEGRLELLPGDVVKVDFDHIVPILFEGEYVMTVAVAEGYGHDHVQHHYIHEALILRSVGSRILHGISGFGDLKTTIHISRNSANHNQRLVNLEEAANE